MLIGISALLLWNALSDGAFTFTDRSDHSRSETIDTEENPIMFSTLIGIFTIIGGTGIRLLITKARKEKTDFEDESGQFLWKAEPFYKTAFIHFVMSYFGMTYLIVLTICIYFSDFSSIQTNLIMASIMGSILLAKVLMICSSTPKEIKEKDDGYIFSRWIFPNLFIPKERIGKHSIDDKRVSIWFNEHEQVAFSRDIFPEGAARALKRKLKKSANKSVVTTPGAAAPSA